ncbi:LuxR family transcriptional regulator [Streptomyces peucetius]|uniref:LuxR family transcriptional regulator n=1 Tax=Streptomyces peucetius TaxID=1950 RepID=A0ABY6I8M5_STRPE|nr:LuxR family transcriptional regulator [Streptomyces peucetius]UYQ63343.1 LuxR family transcriptional regulator [Streptomyces peucetius]
MLFALRDAVDDRAAARELRITERTVKFHIARMRAKMGGISRTRLCAVAAVHALRDCAHCVAVRTVTEPPGPARG